jgi:U3 small nucleolar RNA-associated protein 18
MQICAFSPTGDVLAVAGRRGYVHLVDWKSGAGQVVGSLKMNAAVKSLWWAKGGNREGKELMSLSENAEVYVWDVAERRCTRRWQDDGGFGSRVIHGDQGGKYLAIGYACSFESPFAAINFSFLLFIPLELTAGSSTSTILMMDCPAETIGQNR